MPFLSAFIIFTAACVLLLVSLKILVSAERRKALQTQLSSLAMSYELKELLIKIQIHRGMTVAFLKGDTSFESAIAKRRQEIECVFETLRATTRKNSVYFAELDCLYSDWRNLRDRAFGLSSTRCFIEHNRLVDAVLFFVMTVAEQNQLKTPKLFALEYVGIIWQLFPVTAESLGRIRAVGSGIAASEAPQVLDRIQLEFLIGKIEKALGQVEGRLQCVQEADEELRCIFERIHRELTDFIETTAAQLLVPGKSAISAVEFFDRATSSMNSVYTLYDRGHMMVARNVEAGFQATRGQVGFVSGTMLLGSLAALISAIAILPT